jgi:hypothetical protein
MVLPGWWHCREQRSGGRTVRNSCKLFSGANLPAVPFSSRFPRQMPIFSTGDRARLEVAGGKVGKMKLRLAVLAVAGWLGMAAVGVAAQVPAHPVPVPPPSIESGVGSQSPENGACLAHGLVTAAVGVAAQAPAHPVPVPPPNGENGSCGKDLEAGGCLANGTTCQQSCGENCFDKLCRWLSYRPKPNSCVCRAKCDCTHGCVPPLYVFFLRPGCGAPGVAACGLAP